MFEPDRSQEIEARLARIEAERIELLNELRDLRAKNRSTNPSFALDERTYHYARALGN